MIFKDTLLNSFKRVSLIKNVILEKEIEMADLLSVFKMKHIEIKNRLVFAPVVMFGFSDEAGYVNEKHIAHYGNMAKGETGIIIVEAVCISKHGKLRKDQLGIWEDSHIEGLKNLADIIHNNGSVAIMQIHHAGLNTDILSTDKNEIFAPSSYIRKDGEHIREINSKEIETTLDEFSKAAVRAFKAGFDGVELHGAHAYLISQFLSPEVNKRVDAYGSNKALFGVNVIKAVKDSVPADFIVGMRLGANEPDMKTGISYAKAFEEAGVDYLHISTNFSTKEPCDMKIIDSESFWITNLGMNIKEHVRIPVISVFGIKSPYDADRMIQKGYTDFAASARGLLSDSEWIIKFKNNQETNPCLKCKSCAFRTAEKNCPARAKLNKKQS